MSWQHKAACRGANVELFFPTGATGPAALQIAEAKQVCMGCSVRDDCLQWAVELGVEHGVWGGLAEEERIALFGRTIRRRASRNSPGSLR